MKNKNGTGITLAVNFTAEYIKFFIGVLFMQRMQYHRHATPDLLIQSKPVPSFRASPNVGSRESYLRLMLMIIF